MAINFKLDLKDLLLLDYLQKYFESGYSKCKVVDRKVYHRVTYKKILSDLPILQFKNRRLKIKLDLLEKKGIIERYSGLRRELYLFINFDVLSGTFIPNTAEDSVQKFQSISTKVPTIDNKNNNYNKFNSFVIFIREAVEKEFDILAFEALFHKNILHYVSKYSYDLFLKDCYLEKIDSGHFYLMSRCANFVQEKLGRQIERALEECISSYSEVFERTSRSAVCGTNCIY